VTTLSDAPRPVDEMTPRQRARRDALIEAVIDLVREGHDEELSIKEIADRAGVALATVYRYFSSKDHLVAAALLEWASRLEARVARRPPPDGPSSERLAFVLRQALSAYQRQSVFARLLVLVANSSDPHASACYRQMGEKVYAVLERAVDGVDDDTRQPVLQVVGAVWYHCLVEWVNGRMTMSEVNDVLTSTATLLLPDRDRSMRGSRSGNKPLSV
jgi:AcrR family transcriptional regulator